VNKLTPNEKAQGELERLEHAIAQLEITVASIKESLKLPGTGAYEGECLLTSARLVAFSLVRLEAFRQASR
jgi:hypothetical protein